MSAHTCAAAKAVAPADMGKGSRAVLRVFAFAVAAAVLYGGVGAFSNRMHGSEAMWRAALVQGGASALTTATLSSLIDLMLVWLRKRAHQGHGLGSTRTRRVAVAVGLSAAGLGALVHVGLNCWAATPELFMTVAVPAIGLLAYGPLYALGAQARATAQRRASEPDVPLGGSTPRR
jgi:hypothetical protein